MGRTVLMIDTSSSWSADHHRSVPVTFVAAARLTRRRSYKYHAQSFDLRCCIPEAVSAMHRPAASHPAITPSIAPLRPSTRHAHRSNPHKAVAACFRIHERGCKGIVSTNSVPGFLRNTCRSAFSCREKEFTRRMPNRRPDLISNVAGRPMPSSLTEMTVSSALRDNVTQTRQFPPG
jgi:hypothetical protein